MSVLEDLACHIGKQPQGNDQERRKVVSVFKHIFEICYVFNTVISANVQLIELPDKDFFFQELIRSIIYDTADRRLFA